MTVVKFCVYTKVARKTVTLKTLNLDRGLRGNIKSKLSRCQGFKMHEPRSFVPTLKYPIIRYCSKRLLSWLELCALHYHIHQKKIAKGAPTGEYLLLCETEAEKALCLMLEILPVLVDRGFDTYVLENVIGAVYEDVKS